jgi:hypothetical protein
MMNTERRLHPRIRLQLPVTVINRDGETLPAELIDLASRGFAIAVEPQWLGHIEVVDTHSGAICFPVVISLRLQLPGAVGVVSVEARQVYKRRLSQQVYQFGFLITGFDGDGKRLLSEFIQRHRAAGL